MDRRFDDGGVDAHLRAARDATLARDLDDGKYALSWYESDSDAGYDAGLTSHV